MNKKKEETVELTPSQMLERNECGLLTHLKYEFDDLGFVNYRKLIPAEFLVPNRQIFIKKDLPVPRTIDGLDDKEILVLLAGWRWLARVRGFKSIEHQILECNPESVVVKTTVCWRGNYETNNEDICFSALATASVLNTASFAQQYLAEIAENRGFSRAVRGFCNISLVGFDEINPEGDKNSPAIETEPNKPHGVLQRKLEERGKTFEKFKSEYVKRNPEAAEWQSINDIPLKEVWDILEAIKKKETK
jgi:hypothetical protein